MQKDNLLKTLERYDKPFEVCTNSHVNDERTIINDIKRTDFTFSEVSKESQKVKFFLYILQKSFLTLPIPYYQGMMEVATVVINLHFLEVSDSLDSSNEDEHKNKIDDITEEEKDIFESILDANQDLYAKYEKILKNILNEKFLALTKNDFQVYNDFNLKFVQMMNSKTLKYSVSKDMELDEMTSFRFMNHTLTFFKRLSGNTEVIYAIFNLILNSDPSMIFCILAYYYEKACKFTGQPVNLTSENKTTYFITAVNETDIKEILYIHDFFTKGKYKKSSFSLFDNKFVVGMCLAVLAISIVISLLKPDIFTL